MIQFMMSGDYWVGFWIGCLAGYIITKLFFKDKIVNQVTVRMDAYEAAKLIESDDEVKKLKKELGIK